MMKLGQLAVWMGVWGLLLVSGCRVPAQIYWSPDGQQAAYIPTEGGALMVIDPEGNILRRFGSSTGGAAWSADSRTLYFAAEGRAAMLAGKFKYSRSWLEEGEKFPDDPLARPAPAEGDAEQAEENEPDAAVISMLRDGRVEPLFCLPVAVLHMDVSPDEKWIAAVALWDAPDGGGMRNVLYVYSVEKKMLHAVSGSATTGMCFSGPGMLAYATGAPDGRAGLGELIELDLADTEERPSGAVLAYVVACGWLRPLGNDLLFTTVPVELPRLAEGDVTDDGLRLYRFRREARELMAFPYKTGSFFMPSPDGKWILFERISTRPGEDDAEVHHLALASADGAQLHILREVEGGFGAMFPNWRGSGQVTFITSPGELDGHVEQDNRRHFEVMQYRLTERMELEPAARLSRDWPVEVKPYIEVKQQQ